MKVGQFLPSAFALTWTNLLRLLLVAWACYWFLKNDADADLWGHIRYGKDLLESRVIPATDPYSYTAGETPWINHEVAAEIALAMLDRIGQPAIQFFKLLAGVISIGIPLFLSRKQQCSTVLWLLLLSTSLTACVWGWATRPQLFSFVFFAVLVWILDSARQRPWLYWLTPPLIAAWTNFHGGFLFGLGCLGFALGAEIIEHWWRGGRYGWRYVHWIGVGLAAVAATLVNPYGYRLHLGLIHELGIPRPQIGEWLPVSWISFRFASANLLIIASAACVLFTRRSMPLYQRAILVVTAIETQMHVRHVVFLSFLAIAWLPEHLQDLFNRQMERVGASMFRGEKPPAVVPAWALVLLLMATASLAALMPRRTVDFFKHLQDRFTTIRVQKREFPVQAVQFMKKNKLRGKIVVPFNWGQYVLDAFHPDLLVSFDGRYGTVYSREVLDLNFDLWYPDDPKIRFRSADSGPMNPAAILDYKDPDWVLVDYRGFPQARWTVAARVDWVLIYQDAVAQLYGRKVQCDDPASPKYVPPAARTTTDTGRTGWERFPAH